MTFATHTSSRIAGCCRKVRPNHVSALVLRQLGCARQPVIGRRDARLLAGMLDFSVSKYYLASAKYRQRQQILFIVSKYS